MRVVWLKSFVTLVNTESFAAAARQMNISTSQLSRNISALEQELGARLLERNTRQNILTSAGDSYYQEVKKILSLLQNAEDNVHQNIGQVCGKLRISVPYSWGESFLMPQLHKFMDKHPLIELDVGFDDSYVDMQKESLDLAIRIGTIENRVPDLIYKPILEDHRHICAAPALLARLSPINTIEDLQHVPCIVHSTRTDWPFYGDDGSLVRIKPSPIARTNNGRCMTLWAIQGRGVIYMPSFFVNEALRSGALTELLPKVARQPLIIWTIYSSEKRGLARIQAFNRWLIDLTSS